MKKITLIIISLLLMISISSCSTGYEEGKFEIKNLNIYREETSNKQIGIRFYNDNPNVPYIGIKEYFKEFYNTELNIKKDNNNFYNINKDDVTYIKLDTINEIIEFKGLDILSKHPDFKSVSGKSYLKLDNKTSNESQFKIVDLKNYNLLTYASNNDVYLPINMLGSLFGGIEGYNVVYNSKDLYVLDDVGELSNGKSRTDEYYSKTYYEVLSTDYNRYEDLAKYNYNQLCFTFDNLRGNTTQLVFGDFNLESIGLNGILESYYPDIKKLLLSTSKTDYDKGILLLFGGLFDGGHTGLSSKNPPNLSYFNELQNDSKFKNLVDRIMKIEEDKMKRRQAYSDAKAITLGVDYSSEAFGYYYNENYKTAFISFDRFEMDYDKWEKYYNGDKSVLDTLEKEDTFAFLRKSLYKAKSNGALNIVFDLTTNIGGSLDALMGVIGLINGAKAYQINANTVDKTRTVKNYVIDINLDGKFDEDDVNEARSFNFKIVGLTSKIAFSCGNYLPAIMKSIGYKLIGEKSGGGNCSIFREATADGYIYSRSGYSVLTDDKGNNIDSGIDVDYSLVSTKEDGNIDVSKVYDIKLISEYMNNLN